MTISAKYPGKCTACNGTIRPGDKIEWEKGAGSRHAKCPTAGSPARAARPAKPRMPRVPELRAPAAGEKIANRRSTGRDDNYEVGQQMRFRGDERYYTVVAVGPKWRDDDSDEWMCQALVRAATEEEARPIIEARAKKERRATLMRELDSMLTVAELTEDHRPADARELPRIDGITHRGLAGHRLLWLAADGSVWRTQSSYDDGAYQWRTTAPRATEIATELLGEVRS